jgi:hypothetical protein
LNVGPLERWTVEAFASSRELDRVKRATAEVDKEEKTGKDGMIKRILNR